MPKQRCSISFFYLMKRASAETVPCFTRLFGFFLITKKVGAVSCTNFNHFRYFGLLPKCNESGVCKFVYFYGQISDQIGKSNLWPCTDGVRLSCLSILRN